MILAYYGEYYCTSFDDHISIDEIERQIKDRAITEGFSGGTTCTLVSSKTGNIIYSFYKNRLRKRK